VTPKRRSSISPFEFARVNQILRNEFASGIMVIIAAALGFAAANSPLADLYTGLRDFRIGPAAWHLDLTLGTWAADGLLAIFFFMVGLELKREFAGGALHKFSTAIVPVAAALGGVIVPAIIFIAFNAGTPAVHGWAVPTATDIAFAVTMLALIAPRIHPMLRVFLLTLAVVDDLIAIVIIAVFYANGVQWLWLLLALVPMALFALLVHTCTEWSVRHRWAAWLILLPIGAVAWVCMHQSGIHATIAGVALSFLVPVAARPAAERRARQAPAAGASPSAETAPAKAERIDLAEIFGYRFGPLSSGIAVPVFAFFAAGVSVGDASRFPFDPLVLGILIGFVVGKPLGIVLTTKLLTRFTSAELGEGVRFTDLLGVACLSGVGFTVALLVTELSFDSPSDTDTARLAVMTASIVATIVAAVFLVPGRLQRKTR